MRSVFALGIAALTGFTAAQTTPQMNYPYTIDPDTVPQSTRGMCYSGFCRGFASAVNLHVSRLLVLSEHGTMPSHLPPAAWRQLHEHRVK